MIAERDNWCSYFDDEHFPPRVSTSTYATPIYLVTQFVKTSVAVRLTDT